MLVLRQYRIYRADLRANPHLLYIFGDNLQRQGMGGQAAEMRGEPNAFGIATKRRPSHGHRDDYFHDDDPAAQLLVKAEFDALEIHLQRHDYKGIVIPLDGIGTGLSMLPTYAPKLLDYINEKLNEL